MVVFLDFFPGRHALDDDRDKLKKLNTGEYRWQCFHGSVALPVNVECKRRTKQSCSVGSWLALKLRR